MNNISKSILDPTIQTTKPWGNLSDKMKFNPSNIFSNKDKDQLQVGIKPNFGQLSLGDKMNQIQAGSDGIPLLRTINHFSTGESQFDKSNKCGAAKLTASFSESSKQLDMNS